MADEAVVIDQIKAATYAADFEAVFGTSALDDTATAYVQVSEAIAAFERTALFSPFTSKFDAVQNGSDVFTVAEQNGRNLFSGKANCARAIISAIMHPNFITDFEYKNIGTPANPDNPFLTLDASLNPDGINFLDLGLGNAVNEVAQNGKFRTPTLRNINETGHYMHNGVFNTLAEVLNFYNRRDVDGITPEVNQDIDNGGNIGNLNLTPAKFRI